MNFRKSTKYFQKSRLTSWNLINKTAIPMKWLDPYSELFKLYNLRISMSSVAIIINFIKTNFSVPVSVSSMMNFVCVSSSSPRFLFLKQNEIVPVCGKVLWSHWHSTDCIRPQHAIQFKKSVRFILHISPVHIIVGFLPNRSQNCCSNVWFILRVCIGIELYYQFIVLHLETVTH